MNGFRTIAATAIAGLLLTGMAMPAHASEAAAAPVPGRFCKTADAGKIVKTAKYGKVKCAKKSGRYRWVDIAG